VTAGLRYDLSIPLYTNNPQANPCCQIYFPTADGGVLRLPGLAAGLAHRYLTPTHNNFAPRIGIAFTPNPKTVIRAGYGIFYNEGATQISSQQGQASEFGVNYDINTVTAGQPVDSPYLTLSNILPAPKPLALGTYPVSTGQGEGYFGDNSTGNAYSGVTYFDRKSFVLPYYQRMLLDVQRQVGSHDFVTVSYAGAQGRKGQDTINLNLPPYQTGWSTDAYNQARPIQSNPVGRWGDIRVRRGKDNSFYNALILQYRHDFSKGLQLTSNYTWGKTVSDYPFTNILNLNVNGGANGFEYPNIRSRGEATFSHRHRFVLSGIWGPEYGKAWPVWAKVPATGWRISGILTFESGDALTVYNGVGNCLPDGVTCGTSAFDNAGFDELLASGNASLSHGDKNFSRQFDTSKFTIPANNVRGNSGLGTVRGPGQENFDLSLAKTFSIYEQLHLEFRADAFNALNHSQWNCLNTTYPSGDGKFPFGSVCGGREGRIGQLALKLVF
jgi:hypothetical protein